MAAYMYFLGKGQVYHKGRLMPHTLNESLKGGKSGLGTQQEAEIMVDIFHSSVLLNPASLTCSVHVL